MSTKIDRMVAAVGSALERLEPLFTKDAKLTFIARFNDDTEADVFISSDDPDRVLELVQRTIAREHVETQRLHGVVND
jgi:hypothetical protein